MLVTGVTEASHLVSQGQVSSRHSCKLALVPAGARERGQEVEHLTKTRRCALAPTHRFSYLYRRKRGHPNLLITTHNSGITPQGVTVIKKSAARKCHARAEDAVVPAWVPALGWHLPAMHPTDDRR